MTKMFAISTLALSMLAAMSSAQAAQGVDGDANAVPGRMQAERFVVRHQAVRVSHPMTAFAAVVVPMRVVWYDLGIDGDANPVPVGGR